VENASATLEVGLHIATPGVFETMRIPLRTGRDFTERDRAATPLVVILNETAARQAWPGSSAIGKRIGLRLSEGMTWWDVVGVVGDVHQRGLRESPGPEMYMPLAQTPPLILDAIQRTLFVVARTSGEPLAARQAIKRAVAQAAPSVAIWADASMDQRVADSLAETRFNTAMLTTLGAIGLVLATVGIFGIISFFVSQRTQEIGVRMALGATGRSVLALVVRQALSPIALGVALGLLIAVAATRVLHNLLYQVGPTDPVTFAAVAGAVVMIGAIGVVVPARRAVRIDPIEALRE
jgi:predicted permease